APPAPGPPSPTQPAGGIGGQGPSGPPPGPLPARGLIARVPPSLIAVPPQPAAALIPYYSPAGMNAATVTNPANYQLVASGGDSTFREGNDVNLMAFLPRITHDAANPIARPRFSQPLPQDRLPPPLHASHVLYTHGVAPLAG